MKGLGGPAPHCDQLTLVGTQALVVAVPLALGGMHPLAQIAAALGAFALLVLWVYKATRLGTPSGVQGAGAPIAALLLFSALVILQTVPLPPWLLASLSPYAHELYSELLPGWPEGGGWTAWRPLALEPLAAQSRLLGFATAFAVFAIIAGYPWGEGPADRDARRLVFGRLVATLFASAILVAAAALLQRSVGNGRLLWVFEPPVDIAPYGTRARGPYANPNHLAGYLEMMIPLAAVYVTALGARVRRRFQRRTDAGRRIALPRYQSLVAAVAGTQRSLIAPLIALAGLGVMLIAHHETDSRGGLVSLAVAGLVCTLGLLRSAASEPRWAWIRRAGTAALSIVALGIAFTGQFVVESATDAATQRSLEPSLGARLLVISQARPLLQEFQVIGAGLGSWVHAFRLRQGPPIEAGLWQYAHNDYLQFRVETGLAGTLILVCFAWAVIRAARQHRQLEAAGTGAAEPVVAHTSGRRALSERPGGGGEWSAAFADWGVLRIGLGSGVVALLVHGFADFNLQIPANALIAMVLLGLLVLSGRPRIGGGHRVPWAPLTLMAVIVFAAAGPLLWRAPFTVDGQPSAWVQIDAADTLFAAEGAVAQDRAIAHARAAVELAPLEPEAHEVLGRTLADPTAGDAAYRRAIRLSPDKARLRDLLALRLWERSERSAALAEFESSMVHAPYLAVHHYLAPRDHTDPTMAQERPAALTGYGQSAGRLRQLDHAISGAIERGLRRALQDGKFVDRKTVAADLATLLEATDRQPEAAELFEAQAAMSRTDHGSLRRAAAAYLQAGDFEAAERVLIDQLRRTPDDGELYRLLAIDVYAAQRDFDAADRVLTAGQRNSSTLMPIYRGMREVLTLRQINRHRTAGLDAATAEISRIDASVAGPVAHASVRTLDEQASLKTRDAQALAERLDARGK